MRAPVFDLTVIRATAILLLLCLSARLVGGEDADEDEDADGEYYRQFSVCENSAIVVEELSVLCDSPGQYYYGSSSYRNQVTCQAEDKARVKIQVEIPNYLGDGVVPYVSVNVQGYGTVDSVQLYEEIPLCEIDDLWSLDGGECPEPGRYEVDPVFYWGEQYDDYSYNFRPYTSVGFSTQQGADYYDLGGANTESCQKATFTNWSNGVRRSVSNTVHTFVVTLGVLFAVVFVGFNVVWYINRYNEKAKEQEDEKQRARSVEDAMKEADDYINEEDIKRIAMMGRERDLIDA